MGHYGPETALSPTSLIASGTMKQTLFPRFARHAVVTFSDQIHLRLSCPPLVSAKSKTEMRVG
jgi:hypothetical protein